MNGIKDEYTQHLVNSWAVRVFLALQRSREDGWRDLYNDAPSVLFDLCEYYKNDVNMVEEAFRRDKARSCK